MQESNPIVGTADHAGKIHDAPDAIAQEISCLLVDIDEEVRDLMKAVRLKEGKFFPVKAGVVREVVQKRMRDVPDDYIRHIFITPLGGINGSVLTMKLDEIVSGILRLDSPDVQVSFPDNIPLTMDQALNKMREFFLELLEWGVIDQDNYDERCKHLDKMTEYFANLRSLGEKMQKSIGSVER